MRERTRVKRMFVLDSGTFVYSYGLMVFGKDLDKRQRIFTPFYAFDTEEGWVLFDTGWPLEAAPILEAMGWEPQITVENTAVAQIEKIGISVSDVSRIILSHLHVDHAGGLLSFPNAQVYVQKDEYAYAICPNSFQALAYAEQTFHSPHVKWSFLEGDAVILPGMTGILANGHTPGLQALVVELPVSGFHILCADSAYLQENIETSLPGGNAWNPVLGLYAVKRLKALQSILGADCFPGHDHEFFSRKVRVGQEIL